MEDSQTGARIVTAVPGPRSQELAERRARYVARGVATSVPALAARGRGATIEDVDGNRSIDFAGGIGIRNVGHAHPGHETRGDRDGVGQGNARGRIMYIP